MMVDRVSSPQRRLAWAGSETQVVECTWGFDDEDYRYWVRLDGPLGRSRHVAADAFEALRLCRADFEPVGWRLGVAGCRKDVWPSGMMRDQGGGLVAYRMVMGVTARTEDLIHVFAEAGCDEVVAYDEQYAFAMRWLGRTP